MKYSTTTLLLGAGFVLAALIGTFATMGRASVMLLCGLVVAYTVWIARGALPRAPAPGLLPLYVAGLVLMLLHFCEEFLTGFQHQFPSLFGYDWSNQRFLFFNATWLAVFAIAALGIYRGNALAYLVAWFFALAAGIGNGVGHILLSLSQGRCFPGTLTAPLCLIIGILLVRRLAADKT
jgi:hypothetical protein